jgi:Raf kinase inhibitor-like YbhB/YbcL family protein
MKRKIFFIIVSGIILIGIALIVVFYLLGPTRGETFSSIVAVSSPYADFILTSPAFTDGNSIPAIYTCDGKNISPPLTWGDPPAGTQTFALIVSDPDAPSGTWTHWQLYDIPSSVRMLPEHMAPHSKQSGLGLSGKNSWGKLGYNGPCPPTGTHHYYFTLYALDIQILTGSASIEEIAQAIQGHILAQTELMGTYTK